MKKLLILCLTAGAACGSDAVDTANHFDGFYFGIGANLTNDKTSGDIEAKAQQLDGDMYSLPKQARFDSKKQTRTGCSLLAGYRMPAGDLTLGVECGVDILARKTYNFDKKVNMVMDNDNVPTPMAGHVLSSDVIPSASVIAGWIVPNLDGMLFIKAGLSRNEIRYVDYVLDNSRVRKMKYFSPFVGLGFDQHLGDGFGLRIEGVFNMKKKKTITVTDEEGFKTNLATNYHSTNIRMMFTKSI